MISHVMAHKAKGIARYSQEVAGKKASELWKLLKQAASATGEDKFTLQRNGIEFIEGKPKGFFARSVELVRLLVSRWTERIKAFFSRFKPASSPAPADIEEALREVARRAKQGAANTGGEAAELPLRNLGPKIIFETERYEVKGMPTSASQIALETAWKRPELKPAFDNPFRHPEKFRQYQELLTRKAARPAGRLSVKDERRLERLAADLGKDKAKITEDIRALKSRTAPAKTASGKTTGQAAISLKPETHFIQTAGVPKAKVEAFLRELHKMTQGAHMSAQGHIVIDSSMGVTPEALAALLQNYGLKNATVEGILDPVVKAQTAMKMSNAANPQSAMAQGIIDVLLRRA